MDSDNLFYKDLNMVKKEPNFELFKRVQNVGDSI